MESDQKHRWLGLLAPISLVMVVVVPGAMSLTGEDGTVDPVEVLVIGDTIPDPAFFFYDPSLTYRVVPYPTWACSWTEEETSRWLKMHEAARGLIPADFIIELPYGACSNQAINFRLRFACDMSIRGRGASILLPVPATSILAHFAPDETHIDPESGTYATRLLRQNNDLLGGRLSTRFTVTATSDPLTGFAGLIDGYHDANLFLMEEPHTQAEIVATIQPQVTLVDQLRGGEPWLVRLGLSHTPSGSRLGATGYVWKCASPLNGVFFFPQGGYVATQVVPGAGYVKVDNLKTGEEHEYAWDIISHIILYSANHEIPDILRAHPARTKFAHYYTDYAGAYRALELAEMASSSSQTYHIWIDLAQIGGRRREAATVYRSGDIEESNRLMENVLDETRSAKLRAERALRLSLFMIHLAVYGVAGATLLIALSVTLHFVYKPRIKLVATTRHRAAEEPIRKSVQAGPSGTMHWRKGLITVILVTVVATPGILLLWDHVSEMVSWQAVFVGESSYERLEEMPGIFTGKLVSKEWREGQVFIDPSEGVAWASRDWSEQRTDLIVARIFWPYELEREGAPPIPVFGIDGDWRLSILARYVGLEVEIKGKLRKPQVSVKGEDYTVQGVRELVPGAIREESQ